MNLGGSAPGRPPVFIRRGWRLAAALLIASPPLPAADGEHGLTRMATALATLDYTGTLVYVRDGHVDALRVLHRVDADGVRERITTLSGQPREIRRSGGGARLVGGVAGDVPVSATGAAAALDARAVQRNYRLGAGGEDRIAGRATRVLEVRPRDAFRYGYRLWLDADSGLPLKSVAYAGDGNAVEQWMFTDIRIGERVGDDELGGGSDAPPPPSAASTAAPGSARWRVEDVPRGFELARIVARGAGGEHLVYSDGLARVSVYVEPLDPARPHLSGLLRRGALSVYGRVLDGQQVTVVGEVPPLTVERIARGVVPGDGR